ncbi:hypothetical protein JAO74_15905 [Sphingomonas sp. BT553]|uniref:Transposase n=1 Tax=Sphingomonas mollis TaxID=2795726 RepID=A0ABS0XTB2_9SPHN|nr:hypothetical protein [Sphingomonas sp. BT553]
MKIGNAFLGLDLHAADIDQGQMLVRRTSQQFVRAVAGGHEPGDLVGGEKTGHHDPHKIARHVDVHGEIRCHVGIAGPPLFSSPT